MKLPIKQKKHKSWKCIQFMKRKNKCYAIRISRIIFYIQHFFIFYFTGDIDITSYKGDTDPYSVLLINKLEKLCQSL